MSYSSNPVADANRYYDTRFAESERQEAMQIEAATQIREAFAAFAPVPYVRTNGLCGSAKLAYLPFAEAVRDLIDYKEVEASFIEVLKTSDCPKVKALLGKLVERHISMWADELGEVL